MSESYYDVALICLNGHSVNSSSRELPQLSADYCNECGEKAINQCTHCNMPIRGYYHSGVIGGYEWEPPAYCHACGQPYPWTQRKTDALAEAIDEAERLTAEEKETLKQSIPDILNQTPKTDAAAARFKRAIAKAGQTGGKLIYDIAVKVATDAVVIKLLG